MSFFLVCVSLRVVLVLESAIEISIDAAPLEE
jgi:hypothetical protein